MKPLQAVVTTIAVIALSAVLAGCETYGESAALGGLIGAASGAIIGHQSDSQGEGAIIGAVVGSAAGAIAKDQQERRKAERSASGRDSDVDDAPTRPRPRPRPRPDEFADETLVLEDITVLPSVVQRGNLVEVSIQYAVLGADDGVRIKESRSLMRNGEEIELFSSRMIYRANGSWVSPEQFRISRRLEPGEYEIVQTVESRDARISGKTSFWIE